MQYSPLTARVAGSGAAAWDIHAGAIRLRQAGEDVIMLSVGDPDQPTPAVMIEAAKRALDAGQTGYSRILGIPELRQAIAERQARRTGQACTADNVVFAPGAQGGVYGAVQCLAGAGDEIIVFEPTYATYEAVIGASGARMVAVPLDPARGFHPDIDRLA